MRSSQPKTLSKTLADELFLPPGEVSKALHRCKDSGLPYWSDLEKRVNRSALLDFLAYGMRHVFPAKSGALVRGVPTAAAAEPLKSHFLDDGEPHTNCIVRTQNACFGLRPSRTGSDLTPVKRSSATEALSSGPAMLNRARPMVPGLPP
jgi:hypothetical protein